MKQQKQIKIMITLKRYLLTLVALLTMTTGAWADDLSESFTTNTEATVYTGEHFKITPINTGDSNGFYLYEKASNNIATIEALNGETITKVEFTAGYYYIGDLRSDDGTVTYNGDVATVSGVNATSMIVYASDGLQIKAVKVYYANPNAGNITELKDDAGNVVGAEFLMPSYDATLEYDIVRNLASNTTLNLLIGTDAVTANTRLRIAKDKQTGKYVPVSALSFTLTDAPEGGQTATLTAEQATAAKLNPVFYLKGDGDTWTPVADENIDAETHLPKNLAVGQVYCLTLVAADDAPLYGGATLPSYTVTLFEGYEVQVPAGEFITYYKDEALTLDADETAAELYTITAVGETTATATPLDVIPASVPLLLKNTAETAKTILLIPTTSTATVDYYEGFKGTLVATTIVASGETSNNYAFNGKQFVWVKNAINIGANKAWLEVATGNATARTLKLVFDDATKITNTNYTNLTNGTWYDLNGRKLQGIPTKKGVYIFNGKKVVVK
jgi:hypothetical protein